MNEQPIRTLHFNGPHSLDLVRYIDFLLSICYLYERRKEGINGDFDPDVNTTSGRDTSITSSSTTTKTKNRSMTITVIKIKTATETYAMAIN